MPKKKPVRSRSSSRPQPPAATAPANSSVAAAPAETLPTTLARELAWLEAWIDVAVRRHFGGGGDAGAAPEWPEPPRLPAAARDRYAALVAETRAEREERLLLALALAPHVMPQRLDVFFLKNEKTERGFTEFGGLKGIHHAGFLPTGETALFLLSAGVVRERLAATRRLEAERPLFARGVLRLAAPAADEPAWSGALSFSSAWLRWLATGEALRPELGAAFPARPVTTALTWDDLVLDETARADVAEIVAWARHGGALLRTEMGRHLKRGFRALFHGPPGTGKTLTAALLGRELGVEVYRVDLSQVVSKYIGETEKNLAAVFAEAERRDWILFFDEADALFGKRTATSSAHDRYANQEVAFLLQRVEDHPGVVILATNLKSNLDEAFARRFQAMVYFAPPDAEQRARLWRGVLGADAPLAADVAIEELARAELTGGQIINVARHARLRALSRGGEAEAMSRTDLLNGIRREFRKEGRAG